MDDRAAVTALKNRDMTGLDALVRRYQTKATRVAYLITYDAQLAEDAMQTAFVRVYDHIHQFDEERPFEPWFMRIVVNLALKSVQGRAISSGLAVADLVPDSSFEPAAAFEAAETEQAVRAALAALSPEQRAVIVLRYYLGYSESEIASEVGNPLGTVRWRLHAARKRLKGLLMGTVHQPKGDGV